MRRLRSPRFRRRLLALGVIAGFAAALAAVVLLMPSVGRQEEHWSDEPATVFRPRAPVEVTAEQRQELIGTARLFVRSAVTRDDPESAYDLVTPALRQGTTRAQWATGDIPVTPYPVASARWRIAYAYPDEVGLEVYLVPTEKNLSAMVFNLVSKRVALDGDARWLVDQWSPSPFAAGAASSPWLDARPSPGFERVSPRTSPLWLLLPVAVLLCGILVAVLHSYRERRTIRRSRARVPRGNMG